MTTTTIPLSSRNSPNATEWSILMLEESDQPQTFTMIDIMGNISSRCRLPPDITETSGDDNKVCTVCWDIHKNIKIRKSFNENPILQFAILYNPVSERSELYLALGGNFGHQVLDKETNEWEGI